ncbi:ubiquitin-like domain-containing protein [Streptomyces sp. AS58]|uniref:ubiquitin-like domain-containing protein n=1 Tax=Streptomyces sp. AS58 TaxID=1519489 RepID=UPI000A8227CE
MNNPHYARNAREAHHPYGASDVPDAHDVDHAYAVDHAHDRYGCHTCRSNYGFHDPYAPDRYVCGPYVAGPHVSGPYVFDPYAYDPYATTPYASDPYASDPYASYDPHTAETLAYGVTYETAYGTQRGAYSHPYVDTVPDTGADTYAPGYETARWAAFAPDGAGAADDTVPETLFPRQAGAVDDDEAPEPDPYTGTGRRSARRRRPRYAERVDGPVRRLLPQALVVAFLAGGTTAFVAEDKAVELNVDGEPRRLHTFADDVTELLAEEGLRVGAHDVVEPAPGAALTDGDEIAVHYGRPVRLTLDGRRSEVWTTAQTVEGALEQLGVRAQGAHLSAPRSRPIRREGLALEVRTERSVTIMADGRARTVRTNVATVAEAVEAAGITLRGQDTTSVPAHSFPRDGQTVTVLRITRTKEVREEQIPFDVERIEDPAVFRGTEIVERAGQPGLRRVTYSLRTVNGVRQKPRRLRTELVREPASQIVKVGTKPLPTSVQGADHLDWQGLAACESGGRPGAVDPSGTYGGLYQFDTGTWHSLGGTGRPQDASAAEQTLRAKKLYLRRGASPWPHCGARLHG